MLAQALPQPVPHVLFPRSIPSSSNTPVRMSVEMAISWFTKHLLTRVVIFLNAYNATPLAPLAMVLATISALPVRLATTWKMDSVYHGALKELLRTLPLINASTLRPTAAAIARHAPPAPHIAFLATNNSPIQSMMLLRASVLLKISPNATPLLALDSTLTAPAA
jgi:hypothetical protein